MPEQPTPDGNPSPADLDLLRRQLARERAARQEAERLLEDKSRQLWEANQALTDAVARLQELSEHDPLTGLSNRRALEEWLSRRRVHRPRTGTLIGVLVIDVDHFKEVNDTYGHAAGDQVLRALAARIGGVVRADDLVVRQGGDEMLVLLDGVHDLDSCVAVATKVHAAATLPLGLDDVELHPSVSIGAAVMTASDELSDAMVRADTALYRAKAAGRGVVVGAAEEEPTG